MHFYLDLSNDREINDLLFITDILITDYSSVIYEYSFFKKPVIFYTPDFDEYVSSRSFFYDFDVYNYGKRANNMDELINSIKTSKYNKEKGDKFYKYFCGACDGNSAKRVVDYFLGDK
ncbi:MAG: CDP-glycerol glycerophosphotransferase family protein [Bacilli bacterium]|nr:CDP-glycerol glycerophosphotransferase family protein [Bacilli bacterium]